MKGISVFKLKCNIRFRKFFLNLMLVAISPTNKLVIILSQNLDKYIVSYQKELFIEHSVEYSDNID